MLDRQNDITEQGQAELLAAADDVFGYASDPRMIRRTKGEVIATGLAGLLSASTRATQNGTRYELVSSARDMLDRENVKQACIRHTVDLSEAMEIWLPAQEAETLDVQDLELMAKFYAVRGALNAHALQICAQQSASYAAEEMKMTGNRIFTLPIAEGSTPQIVRVRHAQGHLARLQEMIPFAA